MILGSFDFANQLIKVKEKEERSCESTENFFAGSNNDW